MPIRVMRNAVNMRRQISESHRVDRLDRGGYVIEERLHRRVVDVRVVPRLVHDLPDGDRGRVGVAREATITAIIRVRMTMVPPARKIASEDATILRRADRIRGSGLLVRRAGTASAAAHPRRSARPFGSRGFVCRL
jgi:hypothetical protein